MNNTFENISKFSIGTETSNSMHSSKSIKQNGGYFFNFNNPGQLTVACMDALNEGNLFGVQFSFKSASKQRIKIDLAYSTDSNNKQNILQTLIFKAGIDPRFKKVMNNVISTCDLSSSVNAQDALGNTALHYALQQHPNDINVLIKLIEKGGDISIKNNEGFKIVQETRDEQNDYDVLPNDYVNCGTKLLSETERPGLVEKRVKYLIKFITTQGYETDQENTEFYTNTPDAQQPSQQQAQQPSQQQAQQPSQPDSVDQVTNMLDAFNNSKQAPQGGGNNDSIDFMHDIMTKFNGGKTLDGGNGIISGKRRVNTYSEFSEMYGGKGDSDSDSNTSSNSDSSGVMKLIKNKTSELHDETIKKIIEIMNVDESVARNYKAALYKKIKEEKPELNGFDRAVEMLKSATKSNLKSINIAKVTENINAHLRDKQTSSSNSSNASTSSSEQIKPAKPKAKASKTKAKTSKK